MKKLIFTLSCMVISSLAISQTYTFERRVNSDFYKLKIFKNSFDNYNYLYKQTGTGMAPGYLDMVKVDTAGHIIDNIAFDFPVSFIESVLPMSDGFLVAATSMLLSPDYVPRLIRLDNQGNVKWAKEYNNTSSNLLSKPVIINESTNEIYLIGSSYPQSSGVHSFYICQIDTTGNVLSTNIYSHTGNPNTDMIIPTDLYKLTNGNYFLVTYLHEPCIPCQSPMVLFLDSSFNVISAHILYTFQSFPAGFKFIQKPDDGFYVVGTFNPSPIDLPYGFIINLSPNLTPVWSKYTTNDVSWYGIGLLDAHILPDNNIIVAGQLYNTQTNRNILLMNVDTTGNILWSKESGPIVRDDELSSWVKDNDAIYVAGSSTNVFNPVTTEGMFMKIDLNGNTTCGNTWYMESTSDFNIVFGPAVVTQSTTNVTITNFTTSPISGMSFSYICSGTVMVSVNDLDDSGKLEIYPNPAVENLHIVFENKLLPTAELIIYNIYGSVIMRSNILSGAEGNKIDISGFPSGIYIVETKSKGQRFSRKFVVNR